ncbi:MAG: LLM class flavin-dependent oxidoreductase [Nitrospinota bacterium]
MSDGGVKFDLGFSSRTVAAYPARRRIEVVRMAEELGFERLWHSNEKFGWDMIASMTLTAARTRRIGIGAALADPYSVHPAITAAAVSTVDEISGGRVVMGIGAGGAGFPVMGVTRTRPVAAIREAIEVIRGMWRGETVTLDGEVIRCRGGRLHYEARPDIPIVVASRGPAVLRMAGEVADGAMIATVATPKGVRRAIDRVAEGARRAGRNVGDVEIIARVDTCVHPDREKAREGVRQMIAFLLWSSFPNRDFVTQAGLKVPERLEERIAARDYELMYEAGPLVPEEFVDAFAWAGTPEEVAAKIGRIADLGVRRFGCWALAPPGGDLESVIRLLAEEVIPRVRERKQDRPG